MYDTNYAMKEFYEHGEIWIQEKLRGNLNTIFDVGSNIGEWSRMASIYNPQAEIHSFEISNDTYKKLIKNTKDLKNIIYNGFGLGNSFSVVDIKYPLDNPQLCTQQQKLYLENSINKKGIIFPGDFYANGNEIETIDYLKIDTEGSEIEVLKGFSDYISKGKVNFIQFEYSYHWVLSRSLLMDVYDMLIPLGYIIGRLTKDGPLFCDYTLLQENFNGSDYLAVYKNAVNLISSPVN